MKKLISVLSAFAMTLTMSSSVFAWTMTEYQFESEDEVVSFIVELEGEPLMASDAAKKLGSNYLETYSAKQREGQIAALQSSVMNTVKEELDIEIEYTYSMLLNGFSLEAPKSAKSEIEAIRGVKNVYIVEDMELYLGTSVSQAGAAPVDTADEIVDTGYTGEGQVIAIIDSEFRTDHEMFKTMPKNPKLTEEMVKTALTLGTDNELSSDITQYAIPADADVYVNEKIPFAYDYVNKSTNTISSTGLHGTHVAGIAAGNSITYPDGTTFPEGIDIPSRIKGVAPEAQLVLMKVGTAGGGIDVSAAVKALDDAPKFKVCAINMSFGSACASPDLLGLYEGVFNTARNCGIMLCAAAGNDGIGYIGWAKDESNGYAQTERIDYSTMGSPSGYSQCTTVGSAVNETYYSSGAVNVNQLASTSSSYSTYGVNSSLELKPEISAPGGNIYSAWGSGVSVKKVASGTSMAAPHMTGVAALMNEYLDAHGSSLSGNDRVNRIENLLMSTANVMYRKDDPTIPYSPRVQGAGLVNAADAMKTPAIIIGDNGKTKINLKDKLGSSFTFSFKVQNLTSNPIVYDDINLTVLTDEAIEVEGEKYVFPRQSVLLDSSNSTFARRIDIAANGTVTVYVTVNLDEQELLANKEIFTNGFFIDGYVSLANTDGTVTQIGIPFTGFYGDWDASPVFDNTIYSEEGSALYKMSGNSSMATMIVTNSFDDNGNKINIINGINWEDIADEDFIVISPNNDGRNDIVGINFASWREIKDLTVAFSDNPNEKKLVFTRYPYYQKFNQYIAGGTINGLTEGQYYAIVEGSLNYENAKTEKVVMPIKVDYTPPSVTNARVNQNTLTVTVSDNHYTEYITLLNDGTPVLECNIPHTDGKKAEVNFDITDMDIAKLTLETCDYAQNVAEVSVLDCVGSVYAKLISESASTNTVFTLENMCEADISGKIIAAYYDNSDTLLSTCMTNISLNPNQSDSFTFTPENASGAKSVKLFIWDMSGIKPLDVSKQFDLNW